MRFRFFKRLIVRAAVEVVGKKVCRRKKESVVNIRDNAAAEKNRQTRK